MRKLQINLPTQTLSLQEAGRTLAQWPVSTARLGPGEMSGSEQTPRGLHRIRLAIGEGFPIYSVFVGRRPTGEIYSPALASRYPQRDWILTRIIWLTGCVPGFNRGGKVDTLRRFIYIHGTPDTEPMGVPASHGCIRMHSAALLELFPRVRAGMAVEIT